MTDDPSHLLGGMEDEICGSVVLQSLPLVQVLQKVGLVKSCKIDVVCSAPRA